MLGETSLMPPKGWKKPVLVMRLFGCPECGDQIRSAEARPVCGLCCVRGRGQVKMKLLTREDQGERLKASLGEAIEDLPYHHLEDLKGST